MLPVLPVLPAVQSHTGKPVHLVIKGKLGLDRTASRAFDGPSPGDNEGVALIWKLAEGRRGAALAARGTAVARQTNYSAAANGRSTLPRSIVGVANEPGAEPCTDQE